MKKKKSAVTTLLSIVVMGVVLYIPYRHKSKVSRDAFSEAHAMMVLLPEYKDDPQLFDDVVDASHGRAFRRSYRRERRRMHGKLDNVRYFTELGTLMRQDPSIASRDDVTTAIDRDWNFRGWMSLRNRLRVNARERAERDVLADAAMFDHLISQEGYAAVAEAYRQASAESHEHEQHFLLLSASAYLADDSAESISKAGEVLLSPNGMRPGNTQWNLTFAAWLLQSSPTELATAFTASEDWHQREERSHTNWLRGWILARRGEYMNALPLLAPRVKLSTTDPLDRLFHTMAFNHLGSDRNTLDHLETAKHQIRWKWGTEEQPWQQRTCAEVVLAALDGLQKAVAGQPGTASLR